MAFQELDPHGEEYELHWLATALVSLFVILGLLVMRIPLLMGMDMKLGYDIMQHAGEDDSDMKDLKEGVRNVWTQISTVSALIFPATIAMIQEGGEVKPFYYESSEGTDDDGSGQRVVIHLQQAYLASMCFTMMCTAYGCSLCLLNFTYVECLSPRQSLAFFLTHPGTVGYPLMLLCNAFTFFWLAALIWMLGTYGTALGSLGLSGILLYWWFVYWAFRTNSEFNPSRCPKEPPRILLSNRCLLDSTKIDGIHKSLYAKLHPETKTALDSLDGANLAQPSQSADQTPAAAKHKESKAQSSQRVAPCDD
ncbi:AASDH [Symbiodinium sp. CCMP2592]|nr:AASDH [Symbiodinium sp. CCMP2592]